MNSKSPNLRISFFIVWYIVIILSVFFFNSSKPFDFTPPFYASIIYTILLMIFQVFKLKKYVGNYKNRKNKQFSVYKHFIVRLFLSIAVVLLSIYVFDSLLLFLTYLFIPVLFYFSIKDEFYKDNKTMLTSFKNCIMSIIISFIIYLLWFQYINSLIELNPIGPFTIFKLIFSIIVFALIFYVFGNTKVNKHPSKHVKKR